MAELAPVEIVQRVDKEVQNTQAVRDNWNLYYLLYTLEYFTMGEKGSEGIRDQERERETYISNRPRVFADKIIDLIANADIQITLPIEQKNKKQRKEANDGERIAYGVLNMADNSLREMGEPGLLPSLAFYVPLFGLAPIRAYVYKDKERKGQTVYDVRVWDPYNTAWSMGSKGLNWACHIRYADQESLEDEYNQKFTGNQDNLVQVYDYWNKEKNLIIIEDKVVETNEHGLSYVPVYLPASSPSPRFHMTEANNIANWYTGILEPIKEICPQLSRAMSNYQHLAGMAAWTPLTILAKGGSKSVEKPDRDPRETGGAQVWDSTVVDKIEPTVTPEMSATAMQFVQMMEREIGMATLSAIAYGQFESSIPVGTTNLLMKATESVLQRPKKAVEDALAWICKEFYRQYKEGDYGSLDLMGTDDKKTPFKMAVDRDKIDDSWSPKVKLVPDLAMDEMQNAQIAAQMVKSGLISSKTAMDRYVHIQDTDEEFRQMANERAMRDPISELTAQIDAMIAEKDEKLTDLIAAKIAEREALIKARMAQLMQMLGPQQALPPGQSGANTGSAPGNAAMPGMQGLNPNQPGMDRGAGTAPPEVMQELSQAQP